MGIFFSGKIKLEEIGQTFWEFAIAWSVFQWPLNLDCWAESLVEWGGVSALVSVMRWPVLVPGPTYISLRLHHETITLLHNLMLTKHRTQRHVHRQIQTPQPHNKQENPRPLTWWTPGQHLYNRGSRAHRAVCQFAMHCIIGMQKQWIMFAPTNPSLQIGIGCSFMGCFSVKCYCLSPT